MPLYLSVVHGPDDEPEPDDGGTYRHPVRPAGPRVDGDVLRFARVVQHPNLLTWLGDCRAAADPGCLS